MSALAPWFDPAAQRAFAAACVLLAYALLCAHAWRAERRRRHRAAAARDALHTPALERAPVLVAYASQTGFAEQIAWQSADLLHSAGLAVQLLPVADLRAAQLRDAQRALFIVSTYGEGDAPDNCAAFVDGCMAQALPLAGLQHGVLALGDRTYANFCGFGRRLDGWLRTQGSTPLFERIDVDNDDTLALRDWLHRIGRLAGTSDLPEWQAPAFDAWRLVARRVLNPGSCGAPVCLLDLQPRHGVRLPSWEAGDLVQVLAPGERDKPREYTIASLPADGRMRLIVRQERRDDGTLGRVSGWLTRELHLGGAVELRVRAHGTFRIGDNAARPLVLIGNGTGYAGLRSHLRTRAAAAARAPCWLVFGERQSAHDRYAPDEIDAWRASGVLAHADLVFSRDQPERRYVQDRLRERAALLRRWVDDGAAIYVCGSLKGMAGGVHDALTDVLGADRLSALAAQRRYRRDVY
ncbi:MAG TPA: sulfite reductase subunit alpha [Burkholderiaceae bacterium]|nr:sulfite reductase subunit alpha [Burkholderiaceae bacterium]